MSDHAFLAPSSAHIWGPGGCPYYPTMAAQFPQEETLENREGTAAHWFATEAVQGREIAEGHVAPNGEIITEEMVDCAQDIIADVQSWMGVAHWFAVEHRVDMPGIHPTQNWGTFDFGGVSWMLKRIWLRDYKYGHRYVDAFENMQGVDYVMGIASLHGIILDASWTVEIGIFQPRCYHPEGPRKIWTTDGKRILELADGLRKSAREAMDPNPEMRTGDHCKDCEGKHACPALALSVGAAIDASCRGTPQALTSDQAGLFRKHVRQAIARLEAMAEGLDAQIEATIRQGRSVPFHELKRNPGKEVWASPHNEVHILGDLYGVDVRKDASLTPKQWREKARKAGIEIDEAVISNYTRENPGKVVVAETANNAAAKAFK